MDSAAPRGMTTDTISGCTFLNTTTPAITIAQMKPLTNALAVLVAVVAAGCNGKPAASPASDPVSYTRTLPSIPTKFDSKIQFTLQWPGNEEFHEASDISDLEDTPNYAYYLGISNAELDGNRVSLCLEIREQSEQTVKGKEPVSFAENYLNSMKNNETSRKSLSMGAKKHPGFEVRFPAPEVCLFFRRTAVMADRQLIILTAAAKDEAVLDHPLIQALFDSFKLD